MDNLDLNMLPELLLPWYRENHRCLPWRETKEPYHIWLSEIMLQQTRVEAVKGYYARFLAELPNIAALAASSPLCPPWRLWQTVMTTLCTSCGRDLATTAGCGI